MALPYRGRVPENGNVANLPTEPNIKYHLGQNFTSPDRVGVVDYPRAVDNSQAIIRDFDEVAGPCLTKFGIEHARVYPECGSASPSWSGNFSLTSSIENYSSDLWINHNQRVARYRAPVPRWYIESPEAPDEQEPSYLCSTCRHIDLEHIFRHEKPRQSANPDEYICLGPLKDILRKRQCGLCRLVGGIALSGRESQQLKPMGSILVEESHDVRDPDMESKYYLTPCVYSCNEYGWGYQVFLRRAIFDGVNDISIGSVLADTAHLSPSYPLGIRLILNEERGGRQVPRDHMDFAWIKRCLQLCELNSEIPRPEFTRSIRVIDTIDMCIVCLDSEARYVTLSYPWGGIKQVKLMRDMVKRYGESGSLLPLFRELPRTIQDAIILVSKIGERYLWVDSLCILQDDEEDVRQQLEQMGKIYGGSLFTIHAVSGEDADYGLPGVRPGTRSSKQIIERVGHLIIANLLPWIEEPQLKGAWNCRAWTFQERALSQRALLVGDGVIFNCWHGYFPEDEHCCHALKKEPVGHTTVKGTTIFYAGLDMRSKPYLDYEHRTNFDLYAMLTSEYTQRHLTFQEDAARAFQGIFGWLEKNHETQFIHGLPETELDAALLWSPIGSCTRRCHADSAAFLFPS